MRDGLAQDIQAFGRDLAGDPDGKAGPRERVAADHLRGQSQLAAEDTNLVLEQLAQRLDQLELHPIRQPADIMVRLDRDAGSADERHGLDHIGIERALGEEFGAADPGHAGLGQMKPE
jgi:hypothetical protein